MKMTDFWNVTPCNPQELIDVSEMLTASIIRDARLHGATPQKTGM
jgi:hypothetical protein